MRAVHSRFRQKERMREMEENKWSGFFFLIVLFISCFLWKKDRWTFQGECDICILCLALFFLFFLIAWQINLKLLFFFVPCLVNSEYLQWLQNSHTYLHTYWKLLFICNRHSWCFPWYIRLCKNLFKDVFPLYFSMFIFTGKSSAHCRFKAGLHSDLQANVSRVEWLRVKEVFKHSLYYFYFSREDVRLNGDSWTIWWSWMYFCAAFFFHSICNT